MKAKEEPEPEPAEPNFAQLWLLANLTVKEKAERKELRKKQKLKQAKLDKMRAKHNNIEKSEKPIIYEGKHAKKNALRELKKDEEKEFIVRRKREEKEKRDKLKERSISRSPNRRQRSPSVSEHSSVSSASSEEGTRKLGPYYSFSDTDSCTSDSSDIEQSEFHENLMNAKRELMHVWAD